MLTTCPCCGTPITADRPLVSLDRNTVAFRGRSVDHVEPQEAVLVSILAEAWPRTVSYESIAYGMWGNHEPEFYRYSIQNYACRARKRLKTIGLDIVAESKRGYRLAVETTNDRVAADHHRVWIPDRVGHDRNAG